MASFHKIDQIIEGVNALLDNTYIISSLGKMFNFPVISPLGKLFYFT